MANESARVRPGTTGCSTFLFLRNRSGRPLRLLPADVAAAICSSRVCFCAGPGRHGVNCARLLRGLLGASALEPRPTRITPFSDYLGTLGFDIVALLVTFALMRLYLPQRGMSHSDQLGAIFRAVTIGNVMAMALATFSLRGLDLPRDMLIGAWLLSILLVWMGRVAVEQFMRFIRVAGLDPESVLIVGTGDEARRFSEKSNPRPASATTWSASSRPPAAKT